MYLLHHTVNDYALDGKYECQCDVTQRPTLSLLVYYYTKNTLLVGYECQCDVTQRPTLSLLVYYYTKNTLLVGIQPIHLNYIFTITVNILGRCEASWGEPEQE